MGAVCLVVHAEGPGDLGAPPPWLAPRYPLPEDALGPAHEIVRRVLHSDCRLPEGAVSFIEPLRTDTGARPRGSQLLDDAVLDEVLAAWGLEGPLVVLLIDADDEDAGVREARLHAALLRNGLDGAAGVAVKELEAWLIADQAALVEVLGPGHEAPRAPEALDRREAKASLARWTGAVGSSGRSSLDIRRQLAAALDLDTVAARCPLFASFRKALAAMPLT